MTDISKLLEIMVRLRDEQDGCPWDVRQSFSSIAPYTIEEAYEVADAIDRGNLEDLEQELGDLLFQVVFHARMAEEEGAFAFGDVVASICRKLTRRHPHVFGSAGERARGAVAGNWERIKAEERSASADGEATSQLDGIPLALPALRRAAKLGKRAAAVGFDWPDAGGVRAKLDEELGELDQAQRSGSKDAVREELGDLLFTVANLGRHLGVDPEQALQEANRKFEARFRGMEATARADGVTPAELDADSLEALWQAQKRR